MAARRREVPTRSALRAGLAVRELLAADPVLGRARRYGLYAAAGGELPTGALADWAVAAGRALLWPRVVGDLLAFVRCRPAELSRGPLGVLEPPAGVPACDLEAGDVVIAPGLAFDRRGGRLGRGGGHYDRALDAAPEGVIFVGLGYGFQCVREVPMGPLDRRVDALLSEDGVSWVGT